MKHAQWERAIILVDMNAFFASIEQLDHPEWRGRPVAVTNGSQGTTIITSSYEARAYGVKTGMRLREARELCPGLIQCPSRPERYAAISSRIMSSLQKITPDIEVFSVDEAFLDVTHCQGLYGSPETIARMAKQTVFAASGIQCSVGVSGDKTTAKFAAKQNKPNGLTVIPPWESRQRLKDVPVQQLCGIGKGTARFLADYGVHTCGDMAQLPISVLARRFGNLGRRIWNMAQGQDPDEVHTNVAAPKSIGHGKVIPPNTHDPEVIRTYLIHMTEKVATRLRRHHMEASHFWVGMKCNDGWLGNKQNLIIPSNDGKVIRQLVLQVWRECWRNQGLHQVQVTALDPSPENMQLDLFSQTEEHPQQLNQVMDSINQRFGAFTLAPARLINRSAMPDVIAPAWKPFGHRQSV